MKGGKMARATTVNSNLAGKVGLGLGTVAITAGAVALGTALANKKNRVALQKQARKAVKGIRRVREVIEDGRGRVQVFAHRVGRIRTGISKAMKEPIELQTRTKR